MKRCIQLILIIFIALSGYGQEITKKQISITGKLIPNPDRRGPKDHLQRLKIELKAGPKVLTSVYTQEDGRFHLTLTPPEGLQTLNIICSSIGYGSVFIGYISASDSSNREITMYLPLVIKKTFFKGAVCPKCGKANKTRTIEYGLSGDGGCIPMMEEYVCSRDEIQF